MYDIPMIGVSGSIEQDESRQFIVRDYMLAILACGGVPVLLSMDIRDDQLQACLAHLDGILLAGGWDVAPVRYNELPHPGLGQVDPLRDEFELRLIEACHRLKMPIFGICRGIQMMNVAMGGTLYQDLHTDYSKENPSRPAMLHSQTCKGHHASHQLCVDRDSMLYQILGETTIDVNSFHHQAVNRVPATLRIAAAAADGVVEAIENAAHPFFLGVQWHPELMYRKDEHSYHLFEAFVEATKQYAELKPKQQEKKR